MDYSMNIIAQDGDHEVMLMTSLVNQMGSTLMLLEILKRKIMIIKS